MSLSALSSSTSLGSIGRTPPPPPPPPGQGGPAKTLSAVAELLGTDSDTLKSKLDSGSTMAELAEAAGVSSDDLISTIAATLPAQGPDGVATDTASMAADIAAGRGPSGPPPAKPPVDAQSGLEALSSALGVSADDLLTRLTDGTGISDLLESHPSVAAQLSATQHKGSIVDGYA